MELPTHYPREYEDPILIKDMSEGYLANQIEFIEHTNVNIEYLQALKIQLKFKRRITFILILDEEK